MTSKPISAFLICWTAMLCDVAIGALVGRPSIVVIMADDLGWIDLQCYGNQRLGTPVLDQLAAEGMRFTDAYAAAPVCPPTRVAMMTGQTPGRLHLTNHAPGLKAGFSLEGSNLQETKTVYTETGERPATTKRRLWASGTGPFGD